MSNFYKVRWGDTLSKIAKEHETTVEAIMECNPSIKNKNHIEAGWIINIPSVDKNENFDTELRTAFKNCLSAIENLPEFKKLSSLL